MSMHRVCQSCGGGFEVTEDDLRFLDRVSPVLAGKKILIPAPGFCPLCRFQRRLAFCNQMYVHLRPSSTGSRTLFTMFTPEVPFPVVEKEFWWGDGWSGLQYGCSFDLSARFVPQFERLRNAVPHYPLSTSAMENSDYCCQASELRNCYLVFGASQCEDCICCEDANALKDCIECIDLSRSELCYDCAGGSHCSRLQSSDHCEDCHDSYFLRDCRACRYCIACANLHHRQYCIFNKQLPKEEYERFLAGHDLSSFEGRAAFAARAAEFFITQPRPHAYLRQVDGVTGNYIYQSSRISDSFFINACQDIRWGFGLSRNTKDCRDYSLAGMNSELIYECANCGTNCSHVRFCYDCWRGCSNLLYCWMCYECQDCFGCVGLRRAKFCIFNRQYSEAEYGRAASAIIDSMIKGGEWGEFFPLKLSPFPYNETLAQRYFPLSAAQARDFGFKWYDKEVLSMFNAVAANALPDTVPQTDQTITVLSSKSQRPFKITTEELRKYRQLNAPLPRTTYVERLETLAQRLGGIRLYRRRCARSGREVETAFPPSSQEIIWERSEYEKKFFG